MLGLFRRSPRHPPLLLVFNHFDGWHMPDDDGCERPFEITTDRLRLGEADAVVFHIPTWTDACNVRKRRGQKFVALSSESEVNYPRLKDKAFMARFDYTMLYRQDASVWCPYFGPNIIDALRTPPKPKRNDAYLAWFASGKTDQSGRTRLAFELMKRMTLHAYGSILHNRDLPEDSGGATKSKAIATYKFTLAFENSICSDYVTEKFFQPLVAGSVPVYLGAPNVAEYAPGRCCYIDASDYETPADLADCLIFLATDERAYGQYLAWKAEPLRPEFMEMVGRVTPPSFSRLAGLLRSQQ